MGCSNCGSGGCGTSPAGCQNNGNCGTSGCNKMDVFDWLTGMERTASGESDWVEVRFKNTRKEIFKNSDRLTLATGDLVTVEATTGQDVGIVTLTGELVRFQLRKHGAKNLERGAKKIYRKSTQEDIEQWKQAQGLERDALTRARKVIRDLGLNMKVSDAEYQADQIRLTFYYISDERIDFRELIKVLADIFKVRIEMRQIGSRQEAGMIGGIGSCGRELCCSTWLTDFRTVSTSAARYQQLSINPMKLAGQCGKLKCCLNYELDSYLDAIKDFPDHRTKLKTKKGTAVHQKSDIFKGMMWYSYESAMSEFIPLKIDRVKEVVALNEKGKIVDDLSGYAAVIDTAPKEQGFDDVVGQDDLTRFDKAPSQGKKKKKRFNKSRNQKKQNPKG